jgi:oligoribonuclease (3'-5' exoribonuclease)
MHPWCIEQHGNSGLTEAVKNSKVFFNIHVQLANLVSILFQFKHEYSNKLKITKVKYTHKCILNNFSQNILFQQIQ